MGKLRLLTVLAFFTTVFCAQAYQEILELRTGDVILVSLDCSMCPLIENETNSPYSHSGIVIKKDAEVILVAQAIGRGVHHVPLNQFLSHIRRDGVAHIFRARELDELYRNRPEGFAKFELDLWKNYREKFFGLSFDPNFLWENIDVQGREKLYCSEFVAKLLNQSLRFQVSPVPMDFSRNYAAWLRLFRGQLPQGKPGLAPADLSRNEFFYFVNSF